MTRAVLVFCLSIIEEPEEKNRFEQIFTRYEQPLFRVAYQIIKDKGLAEDAVQTTFFYLARDWKKASRLPEDAMKARLYIMIKNASLNLVKKKNRDERLIRENGTVLNAETRADVEEVVLSGIGYKTLVDAIHALPAHYAEALYLEQVCGCSVKEITAITGAKYNTAQKRLVRAKSLLRERFQREDAPR